MILRFMICFSAQKCSQNECCIVSQFTSSWQDQGPQGEARGESDFSAILLSVWKNFSLCFTFNFSLLRQHFEVTVGLFLRFEAGSLLLGVRFVQSRLCREIFAMHACMCSVVFTSVTPWTVTASLLCPSDFPIKNTGVICHFLLQGIFPIQSLNLHLLCPVHWLVSFC